MHYQIGALPAGVDEATAIAEVQRAFADWEAVSCAPSVAFVYDGRVAPGGATAPVVVEWLTTWPHDPGTFSTPTVRYLTCVQGAAIQHNDGGGFEWLVGGSGPPQLDIYTLTLRGVGLALGLGASTVPGAALNATYSGPRELGSDDERGLCALYGEGADVCEFCVSDANCGGDMDLCVPYPAGESFCGRACTVGGSECAADEECADIAGSMQCMRVIEGVRACRVSGTCGACTTGAECPEGPCVVFPEGGQCAATCVEASDCEGPDADCVATGAGPSICIRTEGGGPVCTRRSGMPRADGGPSSGDAGGATADSGPALMDGGVRADAGGTSAASEGCSCRASGHGRIPAAWIALGLGIAAWRRRRVAPAKR